MPLKKGNINQAVSAALLLLLLFIHSVKLLHSHVAIIPHHTCSGNVLDGDDNSEKAISSDCGICKYQVNKDNDDGNHIEINSIQPGQHCFSESLVHSYNNPYTLQNKGRGPPQV